MIKNLLKKNKYLLTLSAGHLFTDVSQGALPAMLPFFIAAGGMNYTQAAGLKFAISLSASATQPIFGIMADKVSMTWLLPLGVFLSGCALSLIGFFPNHYWLMFLVAVISGIGVAAYHPEGARMANRLAGKKKGSSMSIFSVGGTIGFAFGPLLSTTSILYFGLRGSLVLAFLPIIMCIIIFYSNPRMQSFAEAAEKAEKKPGNEQKNEWGKFSWLGIAIASRSIISHSLNTFLPLYWLNVLNQSMAASGMIVSYTFIFGIMANLLSGHLSDRFGTKKIISLGFILLIPSVFFLTHIREPFLAMLILMPISIGQFMVNAPLIVLGQQYLPKNIGFASGVTLGLGVSIGGLAAPFIVGYADLHGLVSALRLLSILPIIGLVIAFTSRPPGQT